jgi:hypothetical protein
MDSFQRAIAQIDAENARDPHTESAQPRELLYAERLTAWVLKLAPNASETLRLAARCQHICRWMIPRDSYPMSKPGYLRWRNDLKNFHARKAGEILAGAGYVHDIIQKVQDLNLKKNFPADPESRILEDALCLVFLEFQLTALAEKTTDEKMINAIQKSWQKMTPAAHQHALALPFGAKEKQLIERALKPKPSDL